MDLRLENDPILKQPTELYDFDNPPEFSEKNSGIGLSGLADSMLITMRFNNGIGLAAPQIGRGVRMFVMKIAGNDGVADEDLICVNPEIIQQSNETLTDQEGCLSFPKLVLTINRPSEIFVSYKNVEGRVLNRWLTDISARCFCHELDHLNGITFDTHAAKLSLQRAKQKRNKIIKQSKRKN